MRRFWACLLAVLLLAGCGAQRTDPPAGEYTVPESETGHAEPGGAFTLTTEWAEYDPSVKQVWFLLRNNSGAEAETGADYRLETLGENGAWYQVPFAENTGWDDILYILPAGKERAFSCLLSMFDHDFSGGGTYRIVKEIAGQTCAGEFRLKAGAPVSAERPYGFAPLEDLPGDYAPEDAARDGCLVFQAGETARDQDVVHIFLKKVRLGIPCQLRIGRCTDEGALVLEDIVCEEVGGAGRFAWRMDDSRDGFSAQPGRTPVCYYSYLTADRRGIALSSGVDAARSYGEPSLVILFNGEFPQSVWDTVDAMAGDLMAGSSIRYRVWSGDGTRYAFLTEAPLEFGYGDAGRGELHTLADYDGLETEILGIRWLDSRTLELDVRQVSSPEGESIAVELWNTETGTLTGSGLTYCTPSFVDPRDLRS